MGDTFSSPFSSLAVRECGTTSLAELQPWLRKNDKNGKPIKVSDQRSSSGSRAIPTACEGHTADRRYPDKERREPLETTKDSISSEIVGFWVGCVTVLAGWYNA